MNLQHYLKHRRVFEILFWVCLCTLFLVANITIIAMDYKRFGSDTPLWEPALWESSSLVVLLCLVPLVLAFDSKVPLRWNTFPKSTIQHLAFSVVFSLLHVALMVGIRKFAYFSIGYDYNFGPIMREIFYEYLKDFRTYWLFIVIIYLYRFVLLRLQGEASVLGPGEGIVDIKSTPPPDRLLVKKLGKEFLIHTKDIEYIEAAGNYVNIFIGERTYPLRETMTKISEILGESNYRRVHRSYLVNINLIREIQPLDSGDALLTLTTNKEIPVSRTYRSTLAAL